MSFEKNYLEIDLSTNSTFDVDVEADYNIVYATGSATGNVVIGVDGASTPRKGMEVRFIFNGDMDGDTLTVFGTNVPTQSKRVRGMFDFFYNGTSWIPLFIPSTDTAFITNSEVRAGAAIALDKLATLTANRAVQTGPGGVPEASATTTTDLAKLSAITTSASQINNATATAALTADLNILTGANAAGLTPTEIQRLIGVTSNVQAQLNAKANTADFSGILEIRSFSVTIPSAQVLTMNASPVTLVPAQGAGLKIKPLAIWGQLDFNSAAYVSNGNIGIYAGGNYFVAAAEASQLLFGTNSRTVNMMIVETDKVATSNQYVANAPLTAQVLTAETTTGDSDITISGLYIVTT